MNSTFSKLNIELLVKDSVFAIKLPGSEFVSLIILFAPELLFSFLIKNCFSIIPGILLSFLFIFLFI